jgi:ATP-binding cassette subfamily F protein uup
MLSGGERNRLLLARLFARPSNLLVLDEPTNDLDAETLELLEEMVGEYAGTLLLVSHDRAFLDNVVTSTLVFEGGGRINEYVGGYSDWLRQRRDSPAPAPDRPGASAPAASMAMDSSLATATASAAAAPAMPRTRRLSYKEQRELAQLPDTIQRLEAEQARLNSLISDPQLFARDRSQGSDALRRLDALVAELERAYARWASLDAPTTS